MTDRAKYKCPICGRVLYAGPLVQHIGSEACVLALHVRRGKHYDTERGPLILKLRQDMDEMLKNLEAVDVH